MRSMSATEVPPNFITSRAMGGALSHPDKRMSAAEDRADGLAAV
jgi:hypothetical protein